MLAPHRMEPLKNGFFSSDYAFKRAQILASDGASVDAPVYLYVHRSPAYRKSIHDACSFAHQNRKKFVYILSPNESYGEKLIADTRATVKGLEDAGCVPDAWAVELYGDRPVDLVPEAVKVGTYWTAAPTITGAALYLLQHAKDISGGLDLFVTLAGRDTGKSTNDPNRAPQIELAVPKDQVSFTLRVTNRSRWVDFIPALRAAWRGASRDEGLTVRFGGADITKQVRGTGFPLDKAQRLAPGATREFTVTLSAAAVQAMKSDCAALRFELVPFAKSPFVRDAVEFVAR
jgi:hypothetical protein